MKMISFTFFGFVAIVFILLLFTNKFIKDDDKSLKTANIILLVASYVFVIYADWRFAVVLAVLTLTTWYFAQRKKEYKFGIIIAILALAFFKYTNFFVESFAKIFGGGGERTTVH